MSLPMPGLDSPPEDIEAYLASVGYVLTVTLKQPVTLGATVTKLELREPTAGEWAQWSGVGGVAQDIKAVSIVAGVPEAAVRLMGAKDVATAARFITLFLV